MKKNIFVFIFVLFVLGNVYAYSIEASFPKEVTLIDKEVSVDLYVSNLANTTENISLVANTSPFYVSFSEDYFRLNPNESKKITLTFSPLANNLEAIYNSSIEIRSQKYYIKETFNIIQKSNKTCLVDLENKVSYSPDFDEYKLDLVFKNKSNISKNIEFIDSDEILFSEDSKLLTIEKNSEKTLSKTIKTEKSTIKIEYKCNGLLFNKEIELPEKKKPKEPSPILTGFFSFIGSINLSNIKFGDFWDSVLFQVLLIIILIILILSFTTRYIKFIYRK